MKPTNRSFLNLKYLYAGLLGLLLTVSCGSSQVTPTLIENKPVAAYEINYNAYNNMLDVQSINVTPPSSRQNFTGKAGIFQIGNAIFTGNLITVTAYITNNDTNPWTGVELQAYQLRSGNSVTVYNPDFGTGWYIDNPAYGAWGWLFTSGTQSSEFTIPAGGRSANKINGFYTNTNFSVVVYIYANVPVISGITPATGLTDSTVTISGYNFSTTQGSVTFNGYSSNCKSWTNNTIVAIVPPHATLGNVVVDTVYANTPYSNPILFTPYNVFTSGNSIKNPAGITVDTSGNIYAAIYNTNNYITELTPTGVKSTYSNGSKTVSYNSPLDVAFDTSGKLYVANYGNNNILVVPAGGGKPSVFANVGGRPDALYFANAGQSWPLYVADGGDGTIYSVAGNGNSAVFSSGFTNPTAIATDASGNVYVGDCSNGSVYKIDPTGTIITTVITGLSCPAGMKLDQSGNIYILDAGTGIMYQYSPITGNYSPYAAGTGIPNANGGFAFNDTFSTLYASQDTPTNDIISIPIK
jgi:sugar lactone lactonase YvrE